MEPSRRVTSDGWLIEVPAGDSVLPRRVAHRPVRLQSRYHWWARLKDRRLRRAIGSEEVIRRIHTHPIAKPYLWAWILVSQSGFINVWWHVGGSGLLFRLWGISLLVLAWHTLQWRSQQLTLTQTRVIISQGLFKPWVWVEPLAGMTVDVSPSYITIIPRLYVIEFPRGIVQLSRGGRQVVSLPGPISDANVFATQIQRYAAALSAPTKETKKE